MASINTQLSSLEKIESKLAAKKIILLEQAMHSTNPNDLLKANTILQNIETRDQSIQPKSYLIDPYQLNSFLGYKDKPYSLTYGMLRKISYAVPIIRAIIKTRIDQVTTFCEPQKDRNSTGFLIRKKKSYYNFGQDDDEKLTKEEAKKIDFLTEFILNCGVNSDSFSNDDFDDFSRKVLNDSLSFDQMTFEVVRNRRGLPHSYVAVDGATIRIAETMDDHSFTNQNGVNNILPLKKSVKGYYPTHVQIKDSAPVNEYYPWELCFGVRNPSTNIYVNGYGTSEIEILVNTITAMLWSEEYNRRFFSQGSAPKGMLILKSGGGGVGNNTLQQFRQQWQAMMAGVYNSWKTPVLEGDVDWKDLHVNNKDMEFSNWQEYLIKLGCAVFCMDPAEINFPLSGSAEQKPLFEGNNEARLKHSKDKGLYPILKFYQRKINKYLIQQLDPRFEFVFCGMDADGPAAELKMDIDMMANFCTVNEIRVKRGLKPLPDEQGGNMIANSVINQRINAEAQQKQQQQMMEQQQAQGAQENGEGGSPYEQGYGDEEEENPIQKAFESYLSTLA